MLKLILIIYILIYEEVVVLGQHHHRFHMHQSGYHCTDEEIAFQFEYIDLVWPSICDSPTAWRLVQLALPDASVFLDVGGNRGYTAAKIFGLWTPGHNLNRKTLKKSILDDLEKKIEINKNNQGIMIIMIIIIIIIIIVIIIIIIIIINIIIIIYLRYCVR